MITFLTTFGNFLLKLKYDKRVFNDLEEAVFLNNAFVAQTVNKFSAAYGIQRIITVSTIDHHTRTSLPLTRLVESTFSSSINLILILILLSHLNLGLSSCLYLSDFPAQTL
jgi:hypothetical protein